jgi:hypothetical protein
MNHSLSSLLQEMKQKLLNVGYFTIELYQRMVGTSRAISSKQIQVK